MSKKEELITTLSDTINQARKSAKRDWYQLSIVVAGDFLYVKGCKTWVPRISYKGTTDSSPMEMSVKAFQEWVRSSLNYLLKED